MTWQIDANSVLSGEEALTAGQRFWDRNLDLIQLGGDLHFGEVSTTSGSFSVAASRMIYIPPFGDNSVTINVLVRARITGGTTDGSGHGHRIVLDGGTVTGTAVYETGGATSWVAEMAATLPSSVEDSMMQVDVEHLRGGDRTLFTRADTCFLNVWFSR